MHIWPLRLEPWEDELVLSAAVKELLRESDERHGLELFASIPHETVNHQPEFLVEPVGEAGTLRLAALGNPGAVGSVSGKQQGDDS